MTDYTLAIALAGVVSMLVTRRLDQISWARLIDLYLVLAAVAVVAGRIGYVAANSTYFAAHVSEMIDFTRTPGLHAQAALAGAAVVGLLMRRMRAAALTICFVGIAASLGCIPQGCGAGREVFWIDGTLPWLLRVDWPDATLMRNPRLPTQIFTVIWLAACAALALRRPACALAVAALGDRLVGLLRA
jgi:prolipoprotein diacylglyceryltransferase